MRRPPQGHVREGGCPAPGQRGAGNGEFSVVGSAAIRAQHATAGPSYPVDQQAMTVVAGVEAPCPPGPLFVVESTRRSPQPAATSAEPQVVVEDAVGAQRGGVDR